MTKLSYRKGVPAALLLGLIVGAPDIAQAFEQIRGGGVGLETAPYVTPPHYSPAPALAPPVALPLPLPVALPHVTPRTSSPTTQLCRTPAATRRTLRPVQSQQLTEDQLQEQIQQIQARKAASILGLPEDLRRRLETGGNGGRGGN